MTRILMVCLGNICRSPLAEGILRNIIKKNNLDAIVDSAGTSAYHIGENPDPRAILTASNHNIDISHLSARQFSNDDFCNFDCIYAMDTDNYAEIISHSENEDDRKKVKLILNVVEPGADASVPDPWMGGSEGFEEVFSLLENACAEIADELV